MKKKITMRQIDRMFDKSNKLNARSMALWKRSNNQRARSEESWKQSLALWDQVLKLRADAGKMLTDLKLKNRK